MRFILTEEKYSSPYSMKDIAKFYLDQMILENRYSLRGGGDKHLFDYDLENCHKALDYEFLTDADYEEFISDMMSFKYTHNIKYLRKYMADEYAEELYDLYKDIPIPEIDDTI